VVVRVNLCRSQEVDRQAVKRGAVLLVLCVCMCCFQNKFLFFLVVAPFSRCSLSIYPLSGKRSWVCTWGIWGKALALRVAAVRCMKCVVRSK
jgi:hypothetical protein